MDRPGGKSERAEHPVQFEFVQEFLTKETHPALPASLWGQWRTVLQYRDLENQIWKYVEVTGDFQRKEAIIVLRQLADDLGQEGQA